MCLNQYGICFTLSVDECFMFLEWGICVQEIADGIP